MNGYTKLFGSIIASTIWRESLETKVVWITMLAMSNKHGIVEASIPGLADMARVSLAETQKALETLASPDTFSRTKDFEGRRIETVDGGWVILNHAKYREKMSIDERREYNRIKQQEFRERKQRASSTNSQQSSITVNHGQSQSAKSAHTEADKQIEDTKASDLAVPKAPRARVPLMDALAACGGADPMQVPPTAWSGIGKALADIKAVCPELTIAEIQRRSVNYRTHYSATLTPAALAKHWALCDKPAVLRDSRSQIGQTELEPRFNQF